ncbi:hypothetical protein ACLIA0_04340 [Bacillaceae bacterium W0354]
MKLDSIYKPVFFHKKGGNANFNVTDQRNYIRKYELNDVEVEKLILELHNLIKVRYVYVGLDLNRTLLKYLSSRSNFEESIVKRRRKVNAHLNVFHFILLDTSFSMKQYWNQFLYKYIKSYENNTLIFFHDTYIYKYKQLVAFDEELLFVGKTLYSNSFEKIYSIVQELNFPCTIEHISDGEISPKEATKTINLINRLVNKYVKFIYKEVLKEQPSEYFQRLKKENIECSIIR